MSNSHHKKKLNKKHTTIYKKSVQFVGTINFKKESAKILSKFFNLKHLVISL